MPKTTVDRLWEIAAVREEEGRQRLQHLLDDRQQQPQEKQCANAQACAAQRVPDVRIRVVDDALDHGEDDADERAAADGEPEHHRRLVAIHLRLVEVDQVEDRDEKYRNEDRRRDQPGDVKHQDARQADREPPPKLVNLGVAEVGKQRREDGGLDDVLPGMGRVAVHAGLRIGQLSGRPLVCSAAGAEHPVRDVVGAVVASHGR